MVPTRFALVPNSKRRRAISPPISVGIFEKKLPVAAKTSSWLANTKSGGRVPLRKFPLILSSRKSGRIKTSPGRPPKKPLVCKFNVSVIGLGKMLGTRMSLVFHVFLSSSKDVLDLPRLIQVPISVGRNPENWLLSNRTSAKN